MSSRFGPIPPRAPIYLSGPQTLHGSPVWHAAIRSLQTQFPASPIWSPKEIFQSRDDWRAHLASRLRECGGLVFLADADAWLGKGVDTEIAAARALGLPVGWLTPRSELLAIEAIELGPPNEADWIRYRKARPTGTPGVAR